MEHILSFLLIVASTQYHYGAYAQDPEDIVFGGDYEPSKDSIVGGEIIKISKTPYLVQITEDDSQICGGSIISEQWVVTAAHCVEDPGNYGVLTGSSFRSKGQKHEVEEVIVHEKYNNDTVDNDIALFKLKKPIKYNSEQKAIKLLQRLPKGGDELVVSGFGKEGEDLPGSKVLKGASLKVIDWKTCQKIYKEETEVKFTKNMFCAALEDVDTCQGDSGGPAVIDGKLAGIVSFGFICADPDVPGTYTQLHNYHKWIASKTGLKL